eukprot:scaffold100395_cov15-Tisochrysis_lutea.AAC.1
MLTPSYGTVLPNVRCNRSHHRIRKVRQTFPRGLFYADVRIEDDVGQHMVPTVMLRWLDRPAILARAAILSYVSPPSRALHDQSRSICFHV